jgi:hypothetical protein
MGLETQRIVCVGLGPVVELPQGNYARRIYHTPGFSPIADFASDEHIPPQAFSVCRTSLVEFDRARSVRRFGLGGGGRGSRYLGFQDVAAQVQRYCDQYGPDHVLLVCDLDNR